MISHFCKVFQSKLNRELIWVPEVESFDQDSVGEMVTVDEMSSVDSRLEATTVRKITDSWKYLFQRTSRSNIRIHQTFGSQRNIQKRGDALPTTQETVSNFLW